MQIKESAIQLYSKHTNVERHQRKSTLVRNETNGEVGGVVESPPDRDRDVNKNGVDASRDRVSLGPQSAIHSRQINQIDVELSEDEEFIAELNIKLLKALFEKLTGRKFHLTVPLGKSVEDSGDKGSTPVITPPQGATGASQMVEQGNSGGLVYEFHESHYEFERTNFQAAGVVNTVDGMQVEINIDVSMSREFYSEQNILIAENGRLQDPLVINFSADAAQMTRRDFQFDIDADGSTEQIGFVAPGSGFLALDKNRDGLINDGSELFGALSGDGFSDLRAYDNDDNGWIDENDSIYENLRIWTRTDSGEEKLVALGQKGIGALYLDHIETLFSEKDEGNQLLGKVRTTGLALKESGSAVTMQQLDLVV